MRPAGIDQLSQDTPGESQPNRLARCLLGADGAGPDPPGELSLLFYPARFGLNLYGIRDLGVGCSCGQKRRAPPILGWRPGYSDVARCGDRFLREHTPSGCWFLPHEMATVSPGPGPASLRATNRGDHAGSPGESPAVACAWNLSSVDSSVHTAATCLRGTVSLSARRTRPGHRRAESSRSGVIFHPRRSVNSTRGKTIETFPCLFGAILGVSSCLGVLVVFCLARLDGYQQVVQTELESAVPDLDKAELSQQPHTVSGGLAGLVFVEFGGRTHHADFPKHKQNLIYPGVRPGHDQRASGRQHPVGFFENHARVCQVLDYRQQGHVIESAILQRERAGDINLVKLRAWNLFRDFLVVQSNP